MNSAFFPKIDYNFWSNRNPYLSDEPLLENIKLGLRFAQKGGLIDDVISTYNQMTNVDLINLIETTIHNCNDSSHPTDDNFLRVFDLIQGWGGKMGNPFRIAGRDAISWSYKAAISELRDGRINSSLMRLMEIKYLGISFATKHLHFWGKFSNPMQHLPIYDARIQTLLYLGAKNAQSYNEYVQDLVNFSKQMNLDFEQIERALFAFSSNWKKLTG
jgi:hypothetical protein